MLHIALQNNFDTHNGEEKLTTSVLIIDDDIEMSNLLKIILKPHDFEVITSSTGDEGLKAIKDLNPEIVILDLMLPGKDGWKVCSEIRKFSQVPILFLSAVNKPGLAVQTLDEGADGYLLKPIKSSVLVAHLNRLVRRARVEKNSHNSNFN